MELTELLKDLLKVVAMVDQLPGIDADVVNIDYHKEVEEDGGGKALRQNK